MTLFLNLHWSASSGPVGATLADCVSRAVEPKTWPGKSIGSLSIKGTNKLLIQPMKLLKWASLNMPSRLIACMPPTHCWPLRTNGLRLSLCTTWLISFNWSVPIASRTTISSSCWLVPSVDLRIDILVYTLWNLLSSIRICLSEYLSNSTSFSSLENNTATFT